MEPKKVGERPTASRVGSPLRVSRSDIVRSSYRNSRKSSCKSSTFSLGTIAVVTLNP